MGVYADPSGVELRFFDADGEKEIREPVQGKGQLHSLPRTVRRGKPDPVGQDYALGSTDWLTDVMVADSDQELQSMTPTTTGASLTSTCSQLVCVQWKVKLPSGQIDAGRKQDCVTLAIIKPGAQHVDGRVATKEIYVFPKGTTIGPGHKMWDKWHQTVDMLLPVHQ